MGLVSSLRSRAFRFYREAECRDHHLYYLFFELTRACSLRCRHCGSDCSRAENPGLDLEAWKSLAEHVARSFGKGVFLVLTGGEALEWPGFMDFAEHLNKLGFSWGLVSNGFSWQSDTATRLAGAGMKSATISLDGPEAAHNHLRRHPESFARALGALESLASLVESKNHESPKHGNQALIFDAVTCVHPGNLEKLDQTGEILLSARVPAWRVFRIFPKGRAREAEDLALNRQQTRQFLDWVARTRPSLAKRGLQLELSCEGWFPREQEAALRSQPGFCRSGINFASILADGSIAGCPNNHPCFNQGSVFKDNFAWVWEHGFEAHRKRDWIARTTCADCTLVSDCRGGALHLWQGGNEPGFCYHH